MIEAELRGILKGVGIEYAAGEKVRFIGADPVFPTPYRIGAAGAAVLGALGLSLLNLQRQAYGQAPGMEISVRAAAAALRSDRYVKVNGLSGRRPSDGVSGLYQVSGGRWNYLHCNLPLHRQAIARVLGVAPQREPMAEAALRWNSLDLEQAVDLAGGCAPSVRTPEEWKALPNTRAVASEPLVDIRKIADCPPIPLRGGDRPLSGLRVIDLSRVLAGPTCGRLLAEYGAEVLKITCDRYPDSPSQETDTGYGKRKISLDIASPAGRERLQALLRNCDVFSQAYRHDAMPHLGFSVEQVAAIRPGIIYASLNAFGFTGPWRNRRGFDTVIQAASGMAHVAGKGEKPKISPASALDYLTGHLMAFGVIVALERRARIGGSYCVNVSLARTCEWLMAMGLVEDHLIGPAGADLKADELAHWLIDVPTPHGTLTRLRPLIRFSDGRLETLPTWKSLGSTEPAWT